MVSALQACPAPADTGERGRDDLLARYGDADVEVLPDGLTRAAAQLLADYRSGSWRPDGQEQTAIEHLAVFCSGRCRSRQWRRFQRTRHRVAAMQHGEFTLDEQLVQLLKGVAVSVSEGVVSA